MGIGHCQYVFVWMRSEWQNDGRMRGISEFSSVCWLPKIPSFLLILSFLVILECQGMKMKKGGISFKGHPIHFHSIPINFIIQECLRMTGWGWNEWYFWSKAKPLILKSSSFYHNSVIPHQYPLLHMTIPFIWGSFLIQISINPLFSPSLSFVYHSTAKW